jgi:hypothetical protein
MLHEIPRLLWDPKAHNHVRLQALMATSMKVAVSWDVTPCSLVEIDRQFRGAYCLHHQDNESTTKQAHLKRRSISTRLHGATFQKTAILVHNHAQSSPTQVTILSHMNPVHTFISYFIRSILIVSSSPNVAHSCYHSCFVLSRLQHNSYPGIFRGFSRSLEANAGNSTLK